MAPGATKKKGGGEFRERSLSPHHYGTRTSMCDAGSRSPSPSTCLACQNCLAGKTSQCTAPKQCRLTAHTFQELDETLKAAHDHGSKRSRRNSLPSNSQHNAASSGDVQSESHPSAKKMRLSPEKKAPPLPINKVARNPENSPVPNPGGNQSAIDVDDDDDNSGRKNRSGASKKAAKAPAGTKSHTAKSLPIGGNHTTRSISHCGSSRSPSPRPCVVCRECQAGNYTRCQCDTQCKLGDVHELLYEASHRGSIRVPMKKPSQATDASRAQEQKRGGGQSSSPSKKKDTGKGSDRASISHLSNDAAAMTLSENDDDDNKGGGGNKGEKESNKKAGSVKKTLQKRSSIGGGSTTSGRPKRVGTPNIIDLRDRDSLMLTMQHSQCLMCTLAVSTRRR